MITTTDLPSTSPQKIAVIGAGISGLSAAWLLGKRHEVTLFERDPRLGGHTNTVDAPRFDNPTLSTPVDTGFIVYNERNYPNLTALFDHLDVPTLETDMSFAASLDDGDFEYSGSGIGGLLARPSNLVRPRFWAMMKGIQRFYAEGQELLKHPDADDLSLGDMVAQGGYGSAFIHDHLLPMAAAIWSTPVEEMFAHPASAFLRFCDNHGLMQYSDRPAWRTVVGGGREYVKRLRADMSADIRIDSGVTRLERFGNHVLVHSGVDHVERFDHVVLACHADMALSLLNDPSPHEHQVLSQFGYSKNHAVLHRDPDMMPKAKRAWASWNYIGSVTPAGERSLTVTYWMNRLQHLDESEPLFVTLNPHRQPSQVIAEFEYDHPVFTTSSLAAQKQIWDLQGHRRTWFCGSYFGAGFHEDGLQSGLAVAEALGGVSRPWKVANESGRIFLTVPNTSHPEAAE